MVSYEPGVLESTHGLQSMFSNLVRPLHGRSFFFFFSSKGNLCTKTKPEAIEEFQGVSRHVAAVTEAAQLPPTGGGIVVVGIEAVAEEVGIGENRAPQSPSTAANNVRPIQGVSVASALQKASGADGEVARKQPPDVGTRSNRFVEAAATIRALQSSALEKTKEKKHVLAMAEERQRKALLAEDQQSGFNPAAEIAKRKAPAISSHPADERGASDAERVGAARAAAREGEGGGGEKEKLLHGLLAFMNGHDEISREELIAAMQKLDVPLPDNAQIQDEEDRQEEGSVLVGGDDSREMNYSSWLLSSEENESGHNHEAILQEMQCLFADADLDGDGTIDAEEFVALIQNWDATLSDQYAAEVFVEIDLDGDGVLDFEEFAKAFEKLIEMSLTTGSAISLANVGADFTGIEAAEFNAAKKRAGDLEQDVVKLKLQHQAELRELKRVSESVEDQLDQSFADFQDRLASEEAKERAVADKLKLAQRERDMGVERVRELEQELEAAQAGKRVQAASMQRKSTALDDQLAGAVQAKEELEEENSMFASEVVRLNGVVDALKDECEVAMAILTEVQDERYELEKKLREEYALENEAARREMEDCRAESDSLRSEVERLEKANSEQRWALQDLPQSQQTVASNVGQMVSEV